jgi:Tfp pilus assembly PilM family ATPase
MSWLDSLRPTSGPPVAVEIAADHVAAATLEHRGGRPVVAVHAAEPLTQGALIPSLTAENVHDRPSLITALNRVLEKAGRPKRVGLVVPDVVAKVSLIRFEQVPARAADLDQLVRWQVRKTAPFAIEDAQVSFVPGTRAPAGQDFVVALARRGVIAEYEALCAEAGAHAGIVDLATFNVVNAVLAAPERPVNDWLLVNMAADSVSIAVLRGSELIFFRNRGTEGEGTLADLVHQSAMYYEDRLQGAGFGRVLLTGAAAGRLRQPADVEQIRRSLQDRLSTPVEMFDPREAAGVADRIATAPALLDTLAPLVGLLLRGGAPA